MGEFTLCSTWNCGTIDDPVLDDKGNVRPCFYDTHNDVDLEKMYLEQICQLCFSDAKVRKFDEVSRGLTQIQSYNSVRESVLDVVSSDGDSCLSSYSLDDPDG